MRFELLAMGLSCYVCRRLKWKEVIGIKSFNFSFFFGRKKKTTNNHIYELFCMVLVKLTLDTIMLIFIIIIIIIII